MKSKDNLNKNYSKLLKLEKCNIQRTKFSSIFVTIKKQIRSLRNSKRLEANSFLDMLHINTEEISHKFISELIPLPISTNDTFSSGDKYEMIINGLPVTFSIMEYNYQNYPIYQIQINPKNFENSIVLFQVIELILGRSLKEPSYKIARCDISFLIEDKFFSTGLLIRTAYFPWKRTTLTYSQSQEVLIGSEVGYRSKSRSSNASSYSDTYKKNAKTNKKKQTLEETRFFTKFEYQVRSNDLKKNQINSLLDLHKIGEKSVFKKISFYDPTIGNITNRPSQKKFIFLQKIVANIGWHHGTKFYSCETGQKFKPAFKNIILPLTINGGKTTLKTSLRLRLKEWLNTWFIKDYVSIYEKKTSFRIKTPVNEFDFEV